MDTLYEALRSEIEEALTNRNRDDLRDKVALLNDDQIGEAQALMVDHVERLLDGVETNRTGPFTHEELAALGQALADLATAPGHLVRIADKLHAEFQAAYEARYANPSTELES
jgi:hypothetical protein